MVRVMSLVDEIRDGELYLVRPQPARRVLWRKPMLRAKIEQDRRRLADEKVAGPQEGRREGRLFRVAHQTHHRPHAIRSARHIHILRARLLERQTHELAAALDRRPVVEFVRHRMLPRLQPELKAFPSVLELPMGEFAPLEEITKDRLRSGL